MVSIQFHEASAGLRGHRAGRRVQRTGCALAAASDETGQPVVITQNGRPAGVLLSPAEFDRLLGRQRFLESMAAGMADADAGRTMDGAELLRRLAERRPGRRS